MASFDHHPSATRQRKVRLLVAVGPGGQLRQGFWSLATRKGTTPSTMATSANTSTVAAPAATMTVSALAATTSGVRLALLLGGANYENCYTITFGGDCYYATLTAAAMKTKPIGDDENCQFMIIVKSVSTAAPISLPPKMAGFCHTSNRLLTAYQLWALISAHF
jgi:hypothetical protein